LECYKRQSCLVSIEIKWLINHQTLEKYYHVIMSSLVCDFLIQAWIYLFIYYACMVALVIVNMCSYLVAFLAYVA
jgi:hypothetical protein